MKYTIQNIQHSKADFDGIDRVYFDFDIHFTEPEELVGKSMFPFDMLVNEIKINHPDLYNYIHSTTKSIDRWGQRDSMVIEIIGEEAMQQLYHHLEEYLLTADWMPKEFERLKLIYKPAPDVKAVSPVKFEEAVADMAEGMNEMKQARLKYLQFCETVEKQIRDTAMQAYPELATGDAAILKEFKHLFVRDIQHMNEKIVALINKMGAE